MSADILDKFTSHLKQVLAKSYSLAAETDSATIEPEHLLLALLLQKGSIGGEILRKANMSHEEVRRTLRMTGTGTTIPKKKSVGSAAKLSTDSKRVIEKAVLTANTNRHKYVGTEHLLSGLLKIDSPVISALMTEQLMDVADLKVQVETILKSTSKFPEITETFEVGKVPKGGVTEEDAAEVDLMAEKKPERAQSKNPKSPALDFFSVDLTDPEVQKNIDPVIGRDKEVERMIQILSRRQKNNPVLLGEPGVGKTAIVEGLAKRIVQGDVPEVLKKKRIVSLDLGLMLAGTIYRGEFEGRIKQVVDEVKNDPDLILFIDELHNIMGAGSTSGSLDAANLLKPALARGDMRCIGATTLAEYKKDIEGDGALERRFQPIAVNPPTAEVAKIILRGLRKNYEQYHGVEITDEAIDAAVTMSERYITDRFLPDKAIDLIDEAAACLKVATTTDDGSRRRAEAGAELAELRTEKEKAVTSENFIHALELKTRERHLEEELVRLDISAGDEEKKVLGRIDKTDIAKVVARATGIPALDLLAKEKTRLLKLENVLKEHVIGQGDVVASVSEIVRRAKSGISNPNRPLASMLFLGPSGVGKTELAKKLAEIVFQDPDALVRIDMSEFSEGFSMTKLVGAPAGYVGYKESTKLTDVVKRKPHCLVLFDEIEKAHGDVHNLLLQVLDDGHITDATGRKIDFKNTIIIMTSNVGGAHLSAGKGGGIGFSTSEGGDLTEEELADQRAAIMQDVEQSFRPEFINRIDKISVFRPLAKADLASIAELQVAELSKRTEADFGVTLGINQKAAELIAEKSYDPRYGARGVRRQIQELIETPLAKELLEDRFAPGETVMVGVMDDSIAFAKRRTNARTKHKQQA